MSNVGTAVTIGTFDIGRRRRQCTYVPSPGFPLSPVQYKTESLGTRLALFGMSGEAMVRVGARPHEKPRIDMATRCFLGGRDTLATCFVPRLLVEQEINGEWTSLTQFNLVGMWYYHAPQDTVRIRITTAAMKATYLRDRVLLKPATADEQKEVQVIIRKPRDGYWPYYHSWEWKDGKEFFKTFQVDTLRVGEQFHMEFPIKPRIGNFTLDVMVDHPNTLTYVQWIDFHAPTLFVQGWQWPTTLMHWPLVPTPSVLATDELAELGYPGGFIIPHWALLEQMELGSDFAPGTSQGPGAEKYKEEIDVWSAEFCRQRDEARRQKRNQSVETVDGKQ